MTVQPPRGSDAAIAIAVFFLTAATACLGNIDGPLPVMAFLASVLALFATAYHQRRNMRDSSGVWVAGAIWASGPHPGRKPARARMALVVGFMVFFLAADILAGSDRMIPAMACAAGAGLWVYATGRWWWRLYAEEFGAAD